MIRKVYILLNLICLALYTIGHAAVGVFTTNTRIIGVRDSSVKLPLVALNTLGWPLAGLISVLRTGGLNGFLASFARPYSWLWLWRVGFTLLGLRYIIEEVNRHRHPPERPREARTIKIEGYDMRREIAKIEGASGLGRLPYLANEFYSLEVSTHEVRIECLPPEFDGFTIVQVSDLHYGDGLPDAFVKRYVELSIGMDPDLIALTGDFQHYPEYIRPAARLLAPIGEWSCRERRGQGALAVLGNHDTWSGTTEVTGALRDVGIKVLNNRHVELRRGKSGAGGSVSGRPGLYVAGVADPWSWRADLRRALLGIPEGACTVLLAHVPDFIELAAEHTIALQLSGHIHGGQVVFPAVGPVLSPSRYNRRYISGFYKKNSTLMYVSRGLGGHPPVRWACNPEVAVLVLRSSANA